VFLLFKLIKPLVLLLVLGAVWVFAPAIGGVSGAALQRDVSGELNADAGPDCTRRGSVTWRCTVRGERYTVRMRDRGCWTARRASSTPVRGCVHLRDQAYALAGIG
jgi:hypothetical protein